MHCVVSKLENRNSKIVSPDFRLKAPTGSAPAASHPSETGRQNRRPPGYSIDQRNECIMGVSAPSHDNCMDSAARRNGLEMTAKLEAK